jgi:putative membrane protein
VHDHTGADGVLGWLVPALVVLPAGAAYLVGVARRTAVLARRWPVHRTASALAGLLLVGAAVSPPVLSAAVDDPRGHMAQHLLLGMYAPLLLVLSAPVTLLLGASAPRTRRSVGRLLGSRAVRVVTSPWVAALLSTGGLVALYLTPLYALSVRIPLLHGLVAAHLLAAGCLYAWSIAGPDPAPGRPGTGQRAVVLVLSAAAHAVLAKVLYAHAGEVPPGAGLPVPAAEQAALWMYYGGDVAEIALAVLLFGGRYLRGTGRQERAPVAVG